MKARKLEFKEVPMSEEVFNEKTKTYEEIKQGTFKYREIVKQILMAPGPQGHVSTDEIVRSIELFGKMKEEIAKGNSHILLDREQYDYLLSRLNNFKWAIAHPAIAQFIKYIRDLNEVDVEEAKPAASST